MRQLLGALVALCVVGAAPASEAATPVRITADHFEVHEAESEALFTGNVVVLREGLTVWADSVTIEYGEGGPENVTSFIATGNVRLKTEDQDATGERAVFDPRTQILRLLGDVVVVNASGTVTGPELIVDLEKNTSVFPGGSGGRVTGVFNTQ